MEIDLDNIIHRESLYHSFEKNAGKKVIAIIAPAGYGKTTLIASYLYSRKIPHIWTNAPIGKTSILFFISKLINSTRAVFPSFGNSLNKSLNAVTQSKELGRNSEIIATDLSKQFIDELQRLDLNEINIVIDDFHNYEDGENSDIITFWENLIKADTNNIKYFITSRFEPSLGINILKAKRNIYIIDTEKLRFTDNEVTEIIQKLYPEYSNSPSTINLDKILNGWITGIHLVMQAESPKKSLNFDNLTSVIDESLYGFFIEEIWSKLDNDIRNFLLLTSDLEDFTPHQCDELFGFFNSGEIINDLVKRNIFINRISSEINGKFFYTFRYNDYFKNFLNKIHLQHFDISGKTSGLISIAEYFISKGDTIKSISYYLKAGCREEALRIISDNLENTEGIRDFKYAENWLADIPEELLINYPAAAYLKVLAIIHLNNDTGKAIKFIDKFLSLSFDRKYSLKFMFLKADQTFTKGDIEKISADLEQMDVSDVDSNTMIYYKYILGKIYYRSGSINYQKSIDCIDEALKLAEDSERNTYKPEIFMLLGNLYHDLGEFEKSLFYRKRSIELSENIYQKMQASSNLSELLIQKGNYDDAYKTLKYMNELFEKYPFRSLKRFLTKSEAYFYYECGDYETSFEKYEELIEIENSVKLKGFLWHNYLMEGLQLYYMDSFEYALQKFDIAESFLHTNDINGKLLVNQGRALCYIAMSNDYELGVAEKNLISIYEFYSANKQKAAEGQISFYLTSVYLKKNQIDTSLKYLKEAFDRSCEKELISLFERELPQHRDLFDLAITFNINKPLAEKICSKYIDRELFPWISDNCRLRIKQQAGKLTDIKLVSFGKSEIYLRGVPVIDEKWIRKKSKILLAYLMSDPQKIHTKDKIMDLFFDEVPGDKADTIYHSTLYNIRTALKIYDIKTDKPKRSKDKTFDYNPQYILYEDKTLRLNPDFYYRADNIEFEDLYSRSKLASLAKEVKIAHSVKAIDMYKGDFLPGYYDSWAEELRIKYKNMYISLLEELVKLLESEKRYEDVINYSELLLNEDRLNDPAHISIISAYAKLGRTNMAKSRLELMLKIYDEELGEKPSAKTLEKINNILS